MSKSLSNLFFFFVIAGSFFLFATPASAATYWWVGGTTNNNTSNPANWSTSSGACANSANTVLPTTGDIINFGSACKNDATIDAPLTVAIFRTLTGYTGTTTVSASTMTVTSQLSLDGGTLYISNGGIVTGPPGTSGIVIGNAATGNGTVIVTGSGSQFIQTISGTTRVRMGNTTGGVGKLYILNGATANTGSIYAAYSPGTTADIIVDGAGTVWNTDVAGSIAFIGRSGTASLTISNGAVVNSQATPFYIGGLEDSAGSITINGTVSIHGTDSQLNTLGSIFVGSSGAGVLIVQNGGSVSTEGAGSRVLVASQDGSAGTLIVGSGYTLDVFSSSGFETGLGTALLPPIATTTITGTAISATSIEWDWNDVIGATGYKIYRASDNVLLATINSTTSNWTQEGLSPNTAYQIYYRGTNAQGEGLAAATSTAYTAIHPPTQLYTTSESNSVTAKVNIFPNDTVGQSGYYFSRSGGGSSGWIQTNSWTDTGLSCGQEYVYSVKYRNADGVETSEMSTTKSTSGCIGGGYTEQWAFPMVPAYGFKVNNKEQPTTTAPITTGVFTKYLQFKQTHADVRRLQMFLNSDPDTKIAGTGAGSPGKETDYFGVLTYRAVIKFQEKYAKDILTPWGFTKGTGYVGKTTLSKINELISGK